MLTIWNFFLEKYKFTTLIVILLILAGLFAVTTLPKEANPEVKVPIGLVTTIYPGASAVDVERLVTDKIEDKIASLDELDNYTSNSREGLSVITVNFLANADLDDRIRALKDAVDESRVDLPDEAEDPTVTQISFDDYPIVVYSLSADLTESELKLIAEDMQTEIEGVKGVSEVRIAGARDQEVQVTVDKRRLDQYGVSITEVLNAIQSANIAFPVGSIQTDDIRYGLRFDAEITDPELIPSIPIMTIGDAPIYVRDVADVNYTLQAQSTISRLSLNGEPSSQAISLSVYKKTGGDITKIVDESTAIIKELQEEQYPEVTYFVSLDNAKEIRKSLGSLTSNGLQTVVIVGLLLFAFLGWRESLLAALSIPLTFLFGFIGLELLGSSINFLSLFALILALGILVDTGIVIVEGLHTYLQRGYEPNEAAKATLKEFQWPLISGTLTTVSAFVPMLFMSGIMGQFVKHIPITVSLVLMGSLFVALALLPMIGARFLKKNDKVDHSDLKEEEKVSKFLVPIQRWYKGQLVALLQSGKKQKRFLAIIALSFFVALSLPMVGALSVIMFPDNDADFFYIDVQTPIGSTLQVTDDVVKRIEEELYLDGRIESFVVNVGTGNSQADFIGGGNTSHLASFTINLYEERDDKTTKVISEYRRKLAPITEADISVSQLESGPPSGAPVSIEFAGEDPAELDRLSQKAQEILEQIPGATEVDSSIDESALEFELNINRAVAAQYNISPFQIAQALRTSVQGAQATTIRYEGEDIDVDVKMQLNPYALSDQDRTVTTINEIQQFILTAPNGKEVPLSSLVTTTIRPGNPSILHKDGDRIAQVTSSTEGTTPAKIFQEFEPHISELDLQPGYTIKLGGENEELQESFNDLFKALFIGIFLIAAILLLQFDSFRQPLFILVSLPLALIGVLPGLALVGQPVSFPAFIGIVALSGVVVNDAIILVDKINVNRRNGMSMYDAIVDAGVSRLQPIILTTVTTVAGILPLTLSDPIWAGLGFSIIFGLMFATVLTLVMVPVLYYRYGEKELKSA